MLFRSVALALQIHHAAVKEHVLVDELVAKIRFDIRDNYFKGAKNVAQTVVFSIRNMLGRRCRINHALMGFQATLLDEERVALDELVLVVLGDRKDDFHV